MEHFVKKNINIWIGILILLSPFLDALTGICLHYFQIKLTIGIIIRVLFLLWLMFIIVFIYKKKHLLIPYLIIGLYFVFFMIGMFYYKGEVSLFYELQNLMKAFYFPLLFVSLYSIKEEIRISKMTLFTCLFLYLILIFVPLVLGIGYKTYEITKAGTLGFYNSANEISGIISLLTPVFFIVLSTSKKWLPKLLFIGIYLTVILMIGTKTPLLILGITIFFSMIYTFIKDYKEKNYRKILISSIVVGVCIIGLAILIPKTNFYKNIRTHLDYLKLNHITEVFQKEEFIDHFIFSQRLTFLKDKALLYKEAPLYQKIFGIGYLRNNKPIKMIEMDYFDVYYSHGIVGFLIFFLLTFYLLYKVLEKKQKFSYERYMISLSLFFIILLSFFTGHILTAPSVSLLAIILIISMAERKKKDLLFAGYNMDLGGIEKALLNLVNRINLEKYNVTIILEQKKGIFLDRINPNIRIQELKVSNHNNVIIRKAINFFRKLWFKILNSNNYDFSCCYTTYSYSSGKIALMASKNTAFYVHSDYRVIHPVDEDFYNFFNTRNIREYKNIIFISNENRQGFIEKYKDLEDKCKVFNNFIDTEEIKNKSKESIKVKRNPKQTIFTFVGRLDDSSKKVSRQINLVKEIPSIDLWIVGDGPDRQKYEDEVKKYHLEKRITFFGVKENPFPYMKQADYVILTSDYEAFSVALLEAVFLQKKIITTIALSDDSIDMKKYAFVVSKEETEMVKQVQSILEKQQKKETIDLDEIQNNRMIELEKIFNE